ncbi:biotin/lipoyl-containing protein, partial [Ralstonia solanacearum]|uniref:biotin/lipoyl-containing protein n=1 Tax=Ralstonia solanacearum TaxID=305 RepID=UPI002E1C1C5B|nr:2-oxo acid dehydrogenase subunit E2 [Ralstonia solanacearum]
MIVFKLPDLGEGLQEAEIVQWHVQVGDTIEADQPLVSVETAKAIVEIPSPQAGRIARLFGQPGDIVHLGAPLVAFEGAGGDVGAAADAGTVVGQMQVGQQVVREAPAVLALSLIH